MIEINNLTNFFVDKKLILGVAKNVLKGENKGIENLSIAFVSPSEIKKINKKYRKKDKPTDVLSFEKSGGFKGEFLEVIICPRVVKEKALTEKKLFKEAIIKTLIHGILHTLGYNHEKSKKEEMKMEEKEQLYFLMSKVKKV